MLSNLPTIGVRFDINKIDSGSYGVECWKTIWRAISPGEICGALLFEGDTAATLNGRENVYCIVIQSTDASAIEKVRTALSQNTAFKNVCAQPMFVDGPKCASEPLPEAGKIDHTGTLTGNASNSRSALGAVKKEQQPASETSTGVVQAPQRAKPASERTKNLPTLGTFEELRSLIKDRFILKGTDFDYDYWLTPEELCDIAENYAELLEVHFLEYSCSISEDLCCVRLFQKNPPEGKPIEVSGLCPLDVASFMREYESAPRYAKALPQLAGIEGKFQKNFGKGSENGRTYTYEKENQIPTTSLWPKIHARQERFAAEIKRHQDERRKRAEEQKQRDEADAKRRAEENRRREEAEAKRKAEQKQRDEAEAKRRSGENKRREEAEAKRRAEQEQLKALQQQRKSQGQCIACGKPLGVFSKFLGRERHMACSP